jgi:hypothetical protein
MSLFPAGSSFDSGNGTASHTVELAPFSASERTFGGVVLPNGAAPDGHE